MNWRVLAWAFAIPLVAGRSSADVLLSRTVYSSAGTYTYVAPANTNYLIIKIWGAGAGAYGPGGFSYGGNGGFVEGTLSSSSGASYPVSVGGGGSTGSAGSPDGGSPSVGNAGGGGGHSDFGYFGFGAGGGGGGSNGDGGLWYSGYDGGYAADGAPSGGAGGDSSSTGNGAAGGLNGSGWGGVTNYSSISGNNTGDPDWASPAGYGDGYVDFTGHDGLIVVFAYQHGNPPVITSSTPQQNLEENQTAASYTITASNAPTSFGASNLPPGLSVNASTGAITGTATSSGIYNSTITATNTYGTGSAGLTWAVALIVPNGSVTPNNPYWGQSVQLYRAATANFGVAWTENVVWRPDGHADVLGNMALGGPYTYTPSAGLGTYSYQFRVVDSYYNYQDQWITFTVVEPTLSSPTSEQFTVVGSTFVSFIWSGASAQAGIASYKIYRNGTFLASTTGLSYTDGSINPSTGYSYTIVTVDTQGNTSSPSPPLSTTTAPDLEVFTPTP